MINNLHKIWELIQQGKFWIIIIGVIIWLCWYKFKDGEKLSDRALKNILIALAMAFVITFSIDLFGFVYPWYVLLVSGMVAFAIAASTFWGYPQEILGLWLIRRNKKKYQAYEFDYGKKYKILFCSNVGTIRLNMLLLDHYLKIEQFHFAYNCVNVLKGKKLLKREEKNISYNVVLLFIQIGAIKKADLLCEEKREFLSNTEYNFAKSLIARYKLQFEEERILINEILNSEETPQIFKVMALNNKAINSFTRDNRVEEKSYLLKAWEQDTNNLHNILPNLIDLYLREGDKEEAYRYFKEYEGKINMNNVSELIKWYNYNLTYFRQLNDPDKVEETVKKFENDVMPKLVTEEQINLKITLLRIRWNNNQNWESGFDYLYSNLGEYVEQKVEVGVRLGKELWAISSELYGSNHEVYHLKTANLLKFLNGFKEDLRHKIKSLPFEFVDEECRIHKDLIWIDQQSEYSKGCFPIEFTIEQTSLRENVIEIAENNECFLSAIEIRLELIDEIIALICVDPKAKVPPEMEWIRRNQDLSIKAMAHLDIAADIIRTCSNDPSVLPFKVQVAHYYACLNEKEKAHEFYLNYSSTKISFDHFANHIRGFHERLKYHFLN